MLHWPSIAGHNWQTFVRLAAPLHLSSALTGDLAESFSRISQLRGEPVANRWLAGQVMGNAREWVLDEIRKAPGVLAIAVGLGLLTCCAMGFEAGNLLDRYAVPRVLVQVVLLPFMLSWTLAFFLRGKELPVGMLSALGWVTLLFGVEVYRKLSGLPAPSAFVVGCAVVSGISWMSGAGIRKWQQVRDYRNREVGLSVPYQHVTHFEYSTMINAPVETVFAFHERPDAIKLLTPWWLFPSFKRLRGEGLEAGVEVVVTTAGISRWHARHVAYEKNRLFVDEMVSGPMKSWRHEHHFLRQDAGTLLTDSIDFVPIGPAWVVLKGLGLLFRFRHGVTKRYCEGVK